MRRSILAMLPLRCILDIQVEILHRQPDLVVWNSEVRVEVWIWELW